MKKYVNDQSVVESKIYINQSTKPFTVLTLDAYIQLSEEDRKKFTEEVVGFSAPGWALATKVERMSIYVPVVSVNNEQVLDRLLFLRNQLKYYFKKCSFFDLVLDKDREGDEFVKNIDEFLGKEGVPPSIVSSILIEMGKIVG